MQKPFQPFHAHRRSEDYGALTGKACYVDDLKPPIGRPLALHMLVVRSPYAHARIVRIHLEEARSLPGVVGAFTGAELVRALPTLPIGPMPGVFNPGRHPLAVERARYAGDPVAVILAETLPIAEDARDLVDVEYEVLPAVVDPEQALEAEASLLYEDLGSNVAFMHHLRGGESETAFARADHVLRLRLENQRLAPSSLESRACMFDFDPASGQLSAWVSSQAIFRARETLAMFLGLDAGNILVHNAEVGGAFGAKNVFLGEEVVAAYLAMAHARPVKWIEQRDENLQAQSQGRGQIHDIEADFQADGILLGLKLRSLADLGAFLVATTTMVPTRVPLMLCGPYRVQAVESEVIGVFTNKAITAPYRGAGRPEATYILERVMDRIAHELGIDPAEVRRRNFIAPKDFPYRTVTGVVYDSGNYQAILERALQLGDYPGWRARQRAVRTSLSPRLLGIGLASFIELSGDSVTPPAHMPREAATVRIRRDGTILVQCGVAHNGQGHFTTLAHIAATVFQLPAEQVEVRMNDSSLPGYSVGTFGSRITQVTGSAVLLAAEAVRDKALRCAACFLEASVADMVLEQGYISVRGTSARFITLGDLAHQVEVQPELIGREAPNPANGTPVEGLAAWREYSPAGAAYASGTHVAVVEIDPDTGEIQVLNYVAVDDCGHILQRELAEAQIHGSLAQGIGQALYEEVVYDEDGQLLSGTLLNYALPLAHMLPTFITDFVETPSPFNPLGAKGVAESGCIGAPPAIVNAVLDALSSLGITTIDMPLTPEKIWALLHARRQRGT